jgi:cytochrome c oxidase subunit 2
MRPLAAVAALVAGLLAWAAAATAVARDGPSFWLPVQGSSTAGRVDQVFYLILWIALFFFALVVGLIITFVLRYRRRPGREQAGAAPTENLRLEIAWTGVPIVAVVVIFVFGVRNFLDLTTPPANSYEIQVTGQKWQWLFTYPNGYVDKDLHVPVDTPVLLTMTSEDVIHGFYIPSFRVKKDVVPGRYTHVWFRATTPGEQDLMCTQYCGTGHSEMHSQVIVHPPGGFEQWLTGAADFISKLPPAEAGARLYQSRGCKQCHSLDGSAGIGPTWKGLFGRQVAIVGGKSVPANEDYIRESVLDPQAQIVAGFEPVMPTYKGRLSDAEITALIAYMKTLK